MLDRAPRSAMRPAPYRCVKEPFDKCLAPREITTKGRRQLMIKRSVQLSGFYGVAFAAGLVAAAMIGPAQAQTQDYPSRSVTFLVPYAPGGGTDVLARLLGEELRTQLKQTFVIENKPGAATAIAAAAVSKSAPD